MKKMFLLTCTLLIVGCDQPDWNDPAYVSKLITESDSSEARMALDKLGGESDELKNAVVPALITVYKKKGANQKLAMSQLVQIRSIKAKEIYLEELSTNATGFAAASAAALGDAKVTEAIPELLKVLGSTSNVDSKVGILQAIGKMPDPRSVKPLIDIIKLDVDNNPIKVHSYACDVLGDIALKNPEAFDSAAIKQLTLSVFFGTTGGRSLDQACGVAIQKLGKPAINELVATFKGEREDIKKLLLKYDTPKEPFPSNSPKLIAAKRLTSLRAPEAVDLFIADLNSVKGAPKTLKGNPAVHYRVKEGAITSEIIRSLGDLRSQKASTLLADVVAGKYVTDQWDEITDGRVEMQLRQEAGYALNQIGDRSKDKILLKMADEGVVNDMEKRWMIAAKSGPVKDVLRYQFNWMMAYSYAMLNDGSGEESLKKLIDKNAKKYPGLSKKMSIYLPVLALAKTCGAKKDDAGKAACYSEKLKDPSAEIREKAVWEIARLNPDVARKTLLANWNTKFLDTREIITSSLYAFGNKAVADAATKILSDEKSKTTKGYKLSHLRLVLLHAYSIKR